jgi:peptidoglycan hydrolase CwlO-like protein
MKPSITFPAGDPTLKLPRQSEEKWAATLAEERRRLQEDHDALREREQNLRQYEERLRALQEEIEAGRASGAPAAGRPSFHRAPTPTKAPFGDEAALQSAWEKLHRAREILEAEQRNLRDDRMTLREQEARLKELRDELAEREARLLVRENAVAAASPSRAGVSETSLAAMSRLTRAPFDMARSVFRGKK